MKQYSFFIFIGHALTIVMLAGCSSTHNLRTDGVNPFGGGFADKELRPGLYQLTASSNVAMWPTFGSARATWKGRADQLCGEGAYDEIVEFSDAGYKGSSTVYVAPAYQAVTLPKYNATISGHILCRSSGITVTEASNYLNNLGAAARKEMLDSRSAELEELGGAHCSDRGSKSSADNYFRRGQILVAMNQYGAALQCLLRVQEEEKDTYVYRQSCSLLAMMYELGWGVDKNIETANTWLKKGGL